MFKKLLKILKTMLTGGIFFLVPLILFLYIVEKLANFTQRLIHPLLKNFVHLQVAGIALQDIAGIALLLLICLIAGLLATTGPLRKLASWLENTFLIYLPGYAITRNLTAEIMKAKDKADVRVILVKSDSGWQPAFLMEGPAPGHSYSTVFIPRAPDVHSGSIFLVDAAHIVPTNVGVKEALKCIRQGGIDAGKVFGEDLKSLSTHTGIYSNSIRKPRP